MQDSRREVWFLLEADQMITGVHPRSMCSGSCVVHNPSKHWMREHPLSFDKDRKAFIRTCSHGMDHQDPDERTYWTQQLQVGIRRKAGTGKKLESLAMEKLGAFACPLCGCGCCDVTTL